MQRINRLLTWPILALTLLTATALAATVPTPDSDAAGWAKLLYAALTSKSWGVLAGLVMVALVYPVRLIGPKVLKTPFGGLVLAFVMSLLATLGTAFAVGVSPTLGLVASSLATAATAAGVWEWLKAHIPGVQVAADKASYPAPLPAAKVA